MNRATANFTSHPSRWRAASLALALAFCAVRVVADGASADPQRFLNDVKTLASPAMEGRGAGTKGIALAADMIEQRYRSLLDQRTERRVMSRGEDSFLGRCGWPQTQFSRSGLTGTCGLYQTDLTPTQLRNSGSSGTC